MSQIIMCDRSAARQARRAITQSLIPIAEARGAALSPACPLHPSHDHLLYYEQQKSAVTQFQWRCGLCGKLFKTEQHLDAHFDRKHADEAPATANTCLGDFCDILRCPSWLDGQRSQHRERPLSSSECKPRELEARRHYCQHLMHDCFTAAADGDGDLHPVFETMDEHYCRPLSCSARQRLRDGVDMPDVSHHAGPGAPGASGRATT